MRFLPANSFAYKMILMALLASSMASATLMSAFLAYDSISLRAQLENRLSSLANIVGQNSAAALNFDDRAAAMEVLQALSSEPSIVSACLYNPSGRLFAQYRPKAGSHECAAQVSPAPPQRPGYLSVIRTAEHRGDSAGTLYLESDLKEIRERWRHLVLVTGSLLIVALIVGGIAGGLLQRRISKPIRELAEAIHEVTERQNFAVRVIPLGTCEIGQLGAGFNGMLSELEKRAEEKKAFETQLEYQALNDELTGLPNRRLLADRLSHALAVGKRNQAPVALIYIDLDGFKLVNDSLGHATGDLLLAQVAGRLRSRVREADTLARLGGDEFAVVLNGPHARAQAGAVAHGLLQVLAPPFAVEEHEITIGASIGISCFPDDGSSAGLLLQHADSAMYAAKQSGKNRMMYFSAELGATARERLNLETQLRQAIAHGAVGVHYQPEFEVGSHRLIRFEALARWTHATLGKIPPAKFIPIAEESGLIVPLGAYIMERACSEAVRWQAIADHPVQVAVNVSSIQFARSSFVDEVAEVLHRTGLNPGLLQIELTESVMVNGVHHVAEAMNRLCALGVSLAIDDFGTGYSCLGYLPKLPFHALKIDRSFVHELESRPELEAMVHSLVTLAHDLGMRVIVEGVETQKQLELVAELGSNEIQGFLLGRPTSDPMALLQRRTEDFNESAEAAWLPEMSG